MRQTFSFTTILVLCAALMAFPRSAWSIKQYSCNGKIQYRPCDQEGPRYSQRLSDTAKVKRSSSKKKNSSQAYARVLEKHFKALPAREGMWRGRVEGNGNVHMRLVIKRDGVVESSRYMGNVLLVNKSTWFAFKSMQPTGPNWSWDIVAYNG